MSTDIYFLIEHLHGQPMEITYVLAAAARTLAESLGGKSTGLLLGEGVESVVSELNADEVLLFENPVFKEFNPESYSDGIKSLLEESHPRALLFGDTSFGAGVASLLSMELNLPLVSSVQRMSPSNGEIRFEGRILGGKMVAEGVVPEPSALICLIPGGYKVDQGRSSSAPAINKRKIEAMPAGKVQFIELVEPEAGDVDIAAEKILISVGRGIQREDNLELAEELAEVIGGVVCASRPVVDQGWLPTSRMVGKSGKSVSPSIYLVFGVSGAPEHVEGITNSDLIVAVNTDPQAPIFNVAQYGAELDMLDLMPVLTEKIRAVKGS